MWDETNGLETQVRELRDEVDTSNARLTILRVRVAECMNIVAMCGDKIDPLDLGRKLASALNESVRPADLETANKLQQTVCVDQIQRVERRGYERGISEGRARSTPSIEFITQFNEVTSALEAVLNCFKEWRKGDLSGWPEFEHAREVIEAIKPEEPETPCACGTTDFTWRICPVHVVG